jgi:UDP-3-O-[3-hydroxymyristoyl] glucosamine N-acyltransferase
VIDSSKAIRLEHLAKLIGAELEGDPGIEVSRPASLEKAQPTDVSFFHDRRLSDHLARTNAGAVIIARADRELFSGNCLIAENPQLAFIAVCDVLLNGAAVPVGVHETACVDVGARLGDGVCVGPNSVIEAGAKLGDGVRIGAATYIGADVEIGAESILSSGVNIYADCKIGCRCRIESGVVIGAPGFGYIESGSSWIFIPQIGSVRIGDDVHIGANTTIDRGSLDDTIIGNGVKLDNQIQVAHNVVIGADTAIAGCTGIAGSARIGSRCKIGGRASILGHLVIADDVTIHATSVVTRSLTEAGAYSSTLTAQPASRWRRIMARLSLIDELYRRVRALERGAVRSRHGRD